MSWFFPILGSTSTGCENVGAAIVGIIMIGILAKIALAAIELTLKAAIAIIPIFLVLLVAYGISECGNCGSSKTSNSQPHQQSDRSNRYTITPKPPVYQHEPPASQDPSPQITSKKEPHTPPRQTSVKVEIRDQKIRHKPTAEPKTPAKDRHSPKVEHQEHTQPAEAEADANTDFEIVVDSFSAPRGNTTSFSKAKTLALRLQTDGYFAYLIFRYNDGVLRYDVVVSRFSDEKSAKGALRLIRPRFNTATLHEVTSYSIVLRVFDSLNEAYRGYAQANNNRLHAFVRMQANDTGDWEYSLYIPVENKDAAEKLLTRVRRNFSTAFVAKR
ncbi:MAG: hypothetical protein UV82_C0015G0024 [Candidatus Magasanikbacteria bacterium GW2011_GWD2_43_18]|uniref:SPOR domain-containing protein n=1 Tax=Candidatus Magasanikbacteria bacterium GW2011_GWE2_42_7 TaxID=1619052 RepID=A0A0G1BB01_9BACT|nr:MAG: hypothetical protein UV18_C0004G0024 [Candidatus Magasanikbacteria bacterium GW2011_GWC2_42_27]KKS70550.1 MAG: hypothetical protein UV42_C0050G0002 [Candidatus Magasanikbacteria bacterium GW2011_GWE2_42_7]KKT03833.1 MAG: hypothetical protein UV82_C0015G0024 [Candidatus Magasanikbacteria bacterium GW2011_GWD2_43_18]KKT25512.1 MAG: hypothetical protein UW10_C0007G0085 [Candidatus Magasanikbacteria bacterium GW2011_GWA2_43_9]HBB38454.1 hypothetical protein [Candidatus Magasanikbacteria bac